jgi:hypothetical protein
MKSWKIAVASLIGLAANAQGQTFSFVSDRLSLAPGITPGAFLTDSNVAQVDAFLAAQGDGPKVVKVVGALSPSTVSAIYGKYQIDYTFADFEGPDAVAATRSLVSQIKGSAVTGPAFSANQAFVGNYELSPAISDPTGPNPGGPYRAYYQASVNMAAEELYPGSPTFRNPAGGNSTAPNVRSALFTLPIERLTLTTAGLPTGHAHVAFVNRFNNYGNSALDSDNNPANGFKFVTADQLPSRGDFKAQVLHYRLRGATGVQGLDGGVEGYTQAQFQSDLVEGWQGTPAVRDVLSDSRFRLATLDTRVKSDGVVKALEESGVVVSGAYSAAKGKLVLLLSNLDEEGHSVSLPAKVGGKTVAGEFAVAAGEHQILEFGAAGTSWDLVQTHVVFADGDRGGVGVPEPGVVGLLVGGAVMGLSRRRRR